MKYIIALVMMLIAELALANNRPEYRDVKYGEPSMFIESDSKFDPPTIALIMNMRFIDAGQDKRKLPRCSHTDQYFFISMESGDCALNETKYIVMKQGKQKSYLAAFNILEQIGNKCWLNAKQINCTYGLAKWWLFKTMTP